MARSLYFILVLISFSSLVLTSQSKEESQRSRPNNLVLLVQRDESTNLYVTHIQKRTPQVQFPFVIDLNGKFMWVTCDQSYLSSTYNAPACNSAQCTRAQSRFCFRCSSEGTRPGCHNDTCGLSVVNPVTHRTAMGELAQDVILIPSAKRSGSGSRPSGPLVRFPQFLFVCAPSNLVQQGGLPQNAQGVVGLGQAPISLPNQLSSNFGLAPKFSLCLPSSASHGVVRSDGFLYFGEGPSNVKLTYTPLIISRQGEYVIHVNSILINNKVVPLNPSLLPINRDGSGGAVISTTTPYTILHHSIFQPFIQQFTSQISGLQQVQSVAPFGVCYDSNKLRNKGVPNIDLVMDNQNAKWRISGGNSMVEVRPGVTCLGFVDGGSMNNNNRAAIVIGGMQLQDNLVQFDVAQSRFGFSNSLQSGRGRHNSCSNFNFNPASETP